MRYLNKLRHWYWHRRRRRIELEARRDWAKDRTEELYRSGKLGVSGQGQVMEQETWGPGWPE
jgi:hypothetical protein